MELALTIFLGEHQVVVIRLGLGKRREKDLINVSQTRRGAQREYKVEVDRNFRDR
jgi:hypothetical protein